MVAKNVITSQYTKEGVKKLLSEVDDIVTKGKTEKVIFPSDLKKYDPPLTGKQVY